MQKTKRFYEALNHALINFENWQRALELIVKLSGATKGIIALRDMKTAELIIPDQVGRMYGSPLLFGFSELEVGAYVTQYASLDPWTEVEKSNYPRCPYALSEHLPIVSLVKTAFWNWLEPQSISDTIVCELECTKTDWVALNLYFDGQNTGIQKKILEFLDEHLPIIKRSWILSQKILAFENGAEISSNFLDTIEAPTALINKGGVVASINYVGTEVMHKHLGFQRKLSVGSSTGSRLNGRLQELENSSPSSNALIRLPSSIDEYNLLIRSIHHSENVVGRKTCSYLVSVEKASGRSIADSLKIWMNPILTQRESEVVKAMAEGITISDYARSVGISENTAKTYARDAREKLGGISSRAIFVKHQLDIQKKLETPISWG